MRNKKTMVKPIRKYRKGQVTLTVWNNEKELNGVVVPFETFQVEKSYKDGEEWKTTNTFQKKDLDDLFKLIVAHNISEVKTENFQ